MFHPFELIDRLHPAETMCQGKITTKQTSFYKRNQLRKKIQISKLEFHSTGSGIFQECSHTSDCYAPDNIATTQLIDDFCNVCIG